MANIKQTQQMSETAQQAARQRNSLICRAEGCSWFTTQWDALLSHCNETGHPLDESLTEKALARRREIAARAVALRMELVMIESEDAIIEKMISRPSLKIVKTAFYQSNGTATCHICGIQTKDRMRGKAECHKHTNPAMRDPKAFSILEEMLGDD